MNIHSWYNFGIQLKFLCIFRLSEDEIDPKRNENPVYATVAQHREVEHAAQTIGSLSPRGRGWDVGVAAGHWHRVTTLGLVIRYSFSASPSCVSTLSCLSDLAAGWTRLALSTVERDSNRETAGDWDNFPVQRSRFKLFREPTDGAILCRSFLRFFQFRCTFLNDSPWNNVLGSWQFRELLFCEKILIFVKKYGGTIFDKEISASIFFFSKFLFVSLRWKDFRKVFVLYNTKIETDWTRGHST